MLRQSPFVAPQKAVGSQAEETAACLVSEAKRWSNAFLPSKLMNVTILGPKANYTNVLPQPLIKRHVFEIIKMTLMHSPHSTKAQRFLSNGNQFLLLKKKITHSSSSLEYIHYC